MKVEKILVSWRGENGEKHEGRRSFGMSCFIVDIDYNVMSQTLTLKWCLSGKGEKKGERESDKERIFHIFEEICYKPEESAQVMLFSSRCKVGLLKKSNVENCF